MSNEADELFEEGIQQRDRLQFELQSEYFSVKGTGTNDYTIEFFFFIPGTLQISKDTYSKDQFYRDQTSLIRFKTPVIPLHDLIQPTGMSSPLKRIEALKDASDPESQKQIKFELKLFGNIVRSQIRDRVKILIHSLDEKDPTHIAVINQKVIHFCHEVNKVLETYIQFQTDFLERSSNKLLNKFCNYVDEFIHLSAQNLLLRLLESIRSHSQTALLASDQVLCALATNIEAYRIKMDYFTPLPEDADERRKEQLVYRESVLNKFILESLLLSTIREAPINRYNQIIATFAAGLAMFLYIFLLALYGRVFLVDASALLVMTVVLYILKDRLKEGLKTAFYKIAFMWFPDYKTKIQTPDAKKTIGIQKESFTFLDKNQVPSYIQELRTRTFHSELQEAQRMENVAYFKKEVKIDIDPVESFGLKALHDIFRFNISQFVLKAGDISEDYFQLDPMTHILKVSKFPKVYHINIIMHKIYHTSQGEERNEYEKVRIVINKDGIRRIEPVL